MVAIMKQTITQHEENLREIGSRTATLVEALEGERKNLKREVLASIADGMTEMHAARCAGLTRQTIRRWLGKAV